MKKLLLVLAAAAAVAAPAASAGGWATVGLSSLPPSNLKATQTWPVDITVLQHGRTPLSGVTPVVTIRNGTGDAVAKFQGKPTGKPGVYHAVVSFPAEGTYSYEVYDGFGMYGGAKTHTFKPVEIGAPGDSFPFLPLGAALALALALSVGTVVALRNRRIDPRPASVTNLKGAA